MGWFWFSLLNSRARGLLRHLVNNTARKWRPSVPTAYELFTRAVVCLASFRNGIDHFKWQRPFWEMASSVSNGNDRSDKWHRPFQMATTVYEREICDGDQTGRTSVELMQLSTWMKLSARQNFALKKTISTGSLKPCKFQEHWNPTKELYTVKWRDYECCWNDWSTLVVSMILFCVLEGPFLSNAR